MPTWELVVVGGGAGGLSAARAAARDGRRVMLVNDGPLGGDCTFTGCIPSKTVVAAANAGLSFAAAFERARSVVAATAATESAAVLTSEGVTVVDGRAAFLGPRSIRVGDRTIDAERMILAMGASPARPPIPGIDDVETLTNETLFRLEEAPTAMVIIGAGPIGVEMAQALARLGVAITLVEQADRVLSDEEPEASAIIERALRSDGVDVRTGSRVDRISSAPAGSDIIVTVDAEDLWASAVLVATGRVPRTSRTGLPKTGVATDARGHVVVDRFLRTNVDGVFAVGDVTGLLPLTHVADEMGRIATRNAFAFGPKRWRAFEPASIPRVTFTDPEVARVGPVEADAAASTRVAFLPDAENDRARAEQRTEGFVKLLAGRRRLLGWLGGGRVRGATIVSPRAGELIHEPALAMRTNMFTGRLAQTVHAYPSWSSGVQKCAAQFFVEIEGRTARPARKRR